MWLGTNQQLDKITVRDVPLLSTEVTVVDSARNLGVIIDSQLSLDAHVAAVCRSGYYQLRQFRPVTGFRSADAAKTVVQAFISRRLDYCNAQLYGVSEGLMRCRLHSVQNAAARLVTGARRRDHITPILRQLHWLRVRQRVTFKIAVLVFQCLTSQPPAYLKDDCQLTSDFSTRRLRSTDTSTCVVRRSNNSVGDRCFAAAGPRLWNMLPIYLRLCDSLEQFKRMLKTHLFGVGGRGALVRSALYKLPYLLTYLLLPQTTNRKWYRPMTHGIAAIR